MTVISLDQIVKNILLKRRYSLHFYLDFLVPAKDCLRELSFDLPMNTLRYRILPIDPNSSEIDMPDDYQDWAGVSLRMGQYLHPLIEDNSLNIIPNYDADFNITPYINGVNTDTTDSQSGAYSGYLSPYWWTSNINSLGENIGRLFGGVGAYQDTFKVDKARKKIKINENIGCTEAVLEYIGNGLDADSATHIDAYAQFSIEAFCMWQFKENNRTYSANEAEAGKRYYEQQVQILRARFSDITLNRLKRIVQKNSIGVKY